MKRITNDTHIPTDPDEAKALLRTSYVQTGDVAPALDLLLLLWAAYPEAINPPGEDGEPPSPNWQMIAWQLAMDFVPGFQEGKAQGRPAALDDGLVECVKELMDSKVAKSINHSCRIIERRGLFPGIKDIRTAYYRRLKKL
jgi:hypothetical protein